MTRTPLFHELPPHDPREEIRNRAITMMAFSCALNTEEIVALNREDLRETPEGYEFAIPKISRAAQRRAQRDQKEFTDNLFKVVRNWVASDEAFSRLLAKREENLKRRAAGQTLSMHRL